MNPQLTPLDAPRIAISPRLLDAGRSLLGHVDMGQFLRMRATLPGLRGRPFLLWEDRVLSYADVYREAERYAALFRRRRNELGEDGPLVVGIYRDNSPSFLFAVLGAALDGDVVVGLNTGFRGDTLEALIDRAKVKLLLTGDEQLAYVEPLLGRPHTLGRDAVLVDAPSAHALRTLDDALGDPPAGEPRRVSGKDPLLVIYTSGTTGTPKGIACSHLKLLGAGVVTWRRIGLRPADRGYVCMPLFHSNAWLLGIMPMMLVGGSFLLKRRFSASAFEDDVLSHGVTYMNYVGQPVHYILEALERKYGTPEAVRAALAGDPRNRFRIAHGTGATYTDREKLKRYLGMEHVYESYGSTEAVITTALQPGDPPDSVGRLHSSRFVILDEHGQECPPATVDERGRVTNYDRAVGEICARMSKPSVLFDGYYGDPLATQDKYRGGYYHSGDLGHVRVVDGKRFLYFDGRTDDWIRKDGENFSAESVAQFAREAPGVRLAVAYGVPAPVADELVAVAVQMREDASFDADAFHAHLLEQQRVGGMDPKWMPDFVRLVERMPMTGTDKVLVRQLKREGFDLARRPDLLLYWRRRGDTTYRRFTRADFDALRGQFPRERAALIDGV